jgi:hypothetical protein
VRIEVFPLPGNISRKDAERNSVNMKRTEVKTSKKNKQRKIEEGCGIL